MSRVWVKLPVWSDEWMFGVTQAEVTSQRGGILYVKIPGRRRRSKFRVEDCEVIRCR